MHKQKRLFCGLSPPLMHRLNITAMCLFSHYHTMLGTVNSSKKRKLPEYRTSGSCYIMVMFQADA